MSVRCVWVLIIGLKVRQYAVYTHGNAPAEHDRDNQPF